MVQKTIIANYGDPDLGKTESILMVYDILCKVADSAPYVLRAPSTFGGDMCAVVTINGIKVGISSHGDVKNVIKKCIDDLIHQGCRIILTSCHSTHDMIKFIKSYAPAYRIWRTSNARIFEEATHPRVAPKLIRSRFNEQWATEIANMIESWCYT